MPFDKGFMASLEIDEKKGDDKMGDIKTVTVYLMSNNKIPYNVEGDGSDVRAREHAKRIITEGFWWKLGSKEVFYPITQIYKVTVE